MIAIKNCIFCGHMLRPTRENAPHSRSAEHIFGKDFCRISRHKIMNMYMGRVGDDTSQLRYSPPLTALKMNRIEG